MKPSEIINILSLHIREQGDDEANVVVKDNGIDVTFIKNIDGKECMAYSYYDKRKLFTQAIKR